MVVRVEQSAENMLRATVRNRIDPNILKRERVEEKSQAALAESAKTVRPLSEKTWHRLINT